METIVFLHPYYGIKIKLMENFENDMVVNFNQFYFSWFIFK